MLKNYYCIFKGPEIQILESFPTQKYNFEKTDAKFVNTKYEAHKAQFD